MGHRESVRRRLDGRLELLDPEHEAAEEHRGEQRQQRQLDGLALRIRDDRDEQAKPERGDEQQADDQREPPRARPASEPRGTETSSQTDEIAAMHRAEEAERQDLADHDLGRAHRRRPESVERAAAALPHDRQGDEGHGHMLEHQRQRCRPVEPDDRRRHRGEVHEDRLRRRGDDLRRDVREVAAADRDRVGLALLGADPVDLAVDCRGERLGDEARVVRLDGIGDVGDHRQLGLPAGFDGADRVVRRDDDDVRLLGRSRASAAARSGVTSTTSEAADAEVR